jgi:hypothetical protein
MVAVVVKGYGGSASTETSAYYDCFVLLVYLKVVGGVRISDEPVRGGL